VTCRFPDPSCEPKRFDFERAILIVLGILVVTTVAALVHTESRYARIEAQLEINSKERRAAVKELGQRLERVETILPGAPEE